MADTSILPLIISGIAITLFALLVAVMARRTRGKKVARDDQAPRHLAVPPPVGPARPVAPSQPDDASPASDDNRPPFEPWRLVERMLANPYSAGGPLYRLCFAGEYGVMPHWQPGAIAHIYCGPARESRHGPAPIGEYVIGSLPTDGLLDLVVRRRAGGDPGDDSPPGRRARFLCEEIRPGDMVAIALRDEPGFLPPPDDVPMILIGNATGIAGLHAHIRGRSAGTRNWLIYGDRNSSNDRQLAAEIIDWVSIGHLERCDLVLTGKDQARRRVVDQLDDSRTALLDWVLAGSAIYVCGSIAMGGDVDSTLRRLLGDDVLKAMDDAGLYRRLLY